MAQPTWKEIEATIQQVVEAAADLLPTIWRYQDGSQPGPDYVGLSLGALITEGVDWVNERYDSTRGDHVQIVEEVGGVREVALQIEAWSSATVETLQAAAAQSVVDKIVTRLRLPTARSKLRSVGFVPFDPGPVNWVPQVIQAGFRGRATCDVRCRMPARAYAEYCDWIAKISISATVKGPPDVAVDIEAG